MILLFVLPVALATQCLQPWVPENGHVIFGEPGPYAPGTVARYSCALGFERVGAEERRCLEGGEWSGDAPLCGIDVARHRPVTLSTGVSQPAECAITGPERGGWWEVELLGEYSVLSVSIELGALSSKVERVELIGSDGKPLTACAVRHSLQGNRSSLTIPCEGERVERVRVVAASRLHLCSARVFAGDAVSAWQCAQGAMDVVGVFDGLCFSASREEKTDWKGAQRVCLDRQASLPIRLSRNARAGLRASLGHLVSNAQFYWIGLLSADSDWRWADGDRLDRGEADWAGQETAAVGADAVSLARHVDWRWTPVQQTAWNSFLCQSKPKFCTSPGVGEAGRVVFSSHSYAIGTSCFYSCEEGYDLEGGEQRDCLPSGRWSGRIPHCIKRDCGDLPEWPTGTITLLNESTTLGSLAQYSCAFGYRTDGETVRECSIDGVWTGREPLCRELDCGDPVSITNGRVRFHSTLFNASAIYTCSEGFRLIGQDQLICSASGRWEPQTPVCYELSTLRELSPPSSSSSRPAAESSLALALIAVLLVAVLAAVVLRWTRTGQNVSDTGKQPPMMAQTHPAPVIYATPQAVPAGGAGGMPPGAIRPDSVIYYASTQPIAQLEIPPHMLQLQHLPNGNIHVTLPIGRPLVRPSLPVFQPSPTHSQLLYSFDHEPIYDTPPDAVARSVCTETTSVDKDDETYEHVPERNTFEKQ